MTIDNFKFIIARNGFFGAGAGMGSQGAQHFGGGAAVVGSSAEGGLGKVLAELGVPGLFLLLWAGGQLALYVWRALKRMHRGDSNRVLLASGTLAFLAVNGVVFTTAHQVYGDVFVLLILGWFTGFLFAALQGAGSPVRGMTDGLSPALQCPLPARRAAACGGAFAGESKLSGNL
jgi:hypothetical protein